MDEPATSIRSGSASARSRSNRANDSGFVLDIAGLPVLVRASDDEHLAVVRAVFGDSALSPDAPRAEIAYGPGTLAVPDREPDEQFPDLDVWRDGEVLHLASGFHGVQARVTPVAAEIVASGAVRDRGFRRIFQPAITHMLAHYGIFVIHAASMRRGELGLLALGETGKGKSTMALAALQHGWRVMGDDLVALWLVDDGAMIRGLPKPMALPSDLGDAPDPDGNERAGSPSPVEGARRLEWDHRRRLHVPTEQLDLEPVRLGAILLVEHGDSDRSSVAPLAGSAITSWLMGSYTSVANAPLMRRFFPVAIAAARVPGWIVHHGTDSATRLSDAARILDEVGTGW